VALREQGYSVLASTWIRRATDHVPGYRSGDALGEQFDVLVHGVPIEDVIFEREIHVAASTNDLAGAELSLRR
jgi:hypothetical protein